ncbi:MAG: hypothetical protein P4L43_12690 [Syntrophobacteraceae bacterium]|nr:hypothetical protein [Syntrophobacteraceae bacterium]
MNPNAEHLLDRFHIAMRLTLMGQTAKGSDTSEAKLQEFAMKELERMERFLWNGDVFQSVAKTTANA